MQIRPMQIQLAPAPPEANGSSPAASPATPRSSASADPALSKGRSVRRTRRNRPQSSAGYPAWGRRLAKWLQPPSEPLSFCAEAGGWLAGGVLFRVATHQILLALPQLWVPVAIALLTPAIVATALSFRVPRLSLLLGYRLCLIAAGLFLTGLWL
ncbi:hypothetical protein HPC62_06545 [Thermoleptolyngbya sichuanensis A183]|uniref:Uncharacterized protein n=1 Tax=Thermoleptolyngbya sichuanensis A183 TaxID=2737172 RepID=A0A6M8B4R4_9CYAN|nr:hypothetical protein [Thermoleptolyngbya sichuanensis]QKD81904.1 hypothetical protein HPC62_06545 [Thermoleptolyngbya sichuanensis A183]